MQQKRHIQILKASLPYMHSPLREACRICVRMFELQQAMHRALMRKKNLLRPAVRMTRIRSQAYLSQSANTARLRSLKRLTW